MKLIFLAFGVVGLSCLLTSAAHGQGPGKGGPKGNRGGGSPAEQLAAGAGNQNAQAACASPANAGNTSTTQGAAYSAAMIQQFDIDGDQALNQTELQACLEMLYAQAQSQIARASQSSAGLGQNRDSTSMNQMGNCNSQASSSQSANTSQNTNTSAGFQRSVLRGAGGQSGAGGPSGGGPRGGGGRR